MHYGAISQNSAKQNSLSRQAKIAVESVDDIAYYIRTVTEERMIMKLFVNKLIDEKLETVELDIIEIQRDSEHTVTLYCSNDYYFVLDQETIDKISQ